MCSWLHATLHRKFFRPTSSCHTKVLREGQRGGGETGEGGNLEFVRLTLGVGLLRVGSSMPAADIAGSSGDADCDWDIMGCLWRECPLAKKG